LRNLRDFAAFGLILMLEVIKVSLAVRAGIWKGNLDEFQVIGYR
jgi:hypothetical protein